MPEKSSGNRYLVLLTTMIASALLFFASYYITHAIVYSSFSRFTIRLFAIMKYFRYVIAVDLIIMAVAVLHLMTVNRLKGNIEKQKGFLYSFFYVLSLSAAFTCMLVFKII
jgi:hypothetical protein